MEDKIRKLLFQPLVKGTLSAIVPDFAIELKSGRVEVPARLTSEDDSFKFTLHFMGAQPAAGLGRNEKNLMGKADQLTVRGQIEGEVAFGCSDVFPPVGGTTRSRGTSTIEVTSSLMHLTPEGSDLMTTSQIESRLGIEAQPGDDDICDIRAHIIFHGPELRMQNAGTERKTKNDFLGEAVSSSTDTHVFSGVGYEGALIQKDEELHLHIKSEDKISKKTDPVELVNRVIGAVAFTMGFHPWPAYREIRNNHLIIERFISPHLNLKQTYLAPVSGSLWSTFRLESTNPLHSIIPTIANGMGALPEAVFSRLEILLWNVRSSALSDLPHSTKMLTTCSALEGLVKLIINHDRKSKKTAQIIWKEASDVLQITWDGWTKEIFDLWYRHRNSLAHGNLWEMEEKEEIGDYFLDYPKLGCAFMTLVAAWCGYRGPILADPFAPKATVIENIKVK
jgi:hypothetical protein